MGVINVLPLSVINKIAAGEVIERPASVVKELLENALDAQPTRIAVEIEDGGRKLIRVTDDGFGMAPDDVALAFASHATSKLKTGDDLFFITTLGFRGEALASIGAVSHARIVSRLRGASEGAEVEVDGGAPAPVRATGAPEGTAAEVADLFFNVPARRKFLKSAATESAHVLELVSRVALANPDVAFRLTHNGRETLNLEAGQGRRRRLGDLYGRELADALLEVDSGDGPLRVQGFAAPPSHCRANSRMQLTYVNRRFVRDRTIAHAIATAYEGALVHGRYPLTFLFLQMDPREVDVNVHPTKIEVRFHQNEMVYRTVLNALREAVRAAGPPAIEPREPSRAQPAARSATPAEPTRPSAPPPLLHSAPEPPGPSTPFDRVGPPVHRPAPAVSSAPAAQRAAEPARAPRRCFQLRDSYIVEERADGVAIVDQHALHERILFADIQRRLEKSRLESQRLLVPAVVNVSRAEAALLLAQKTRLADFGIDISEFGPGSVAVNALPLVVGDASPEALIEDFLSALSSESRTTPVEEHRLALARLVACKAAIKSGQRLTDSEMRSLLDKADGLPERDTCPHGRPTCIFFSYSELDRRFKRQ